MRAIIYTKYGAPEVLQVKEIEKPSPGDDELCIKISATTVSSGDARMRSFDVPPLFWFPYRLMLGITGPRNTILGSSFSGEVESVGKDVKRFSTGDRVFGSSDARLGCYAEYICLPEDSLITIKPEGMGDDEAAALFFGGHTALHFLRKGQIEVRAEAGKDAKKVLIFGASGSVGTYAVQLAKYYDARVTGVCSTSKLELVRSLGADKVVDYTATDFTKSGEKYDIIFDTVGKSPFSASLKSLKEDGFYLRSVHLSLLPILRGLWTSWTTHKKVIGGVAEEKAEDLVFLKQLFEHGHIKPVIDQRYPLDKIVEAHKYVDSGHKQGSVVIMLDQKENNIN